MNAKVIQEQGHMHIVPLPQSAAAANCKRDLNIEGVTVNCIPQSGNITQNMMATLKIRTEQNKTRRI